MTHVESGSAPGELHIVRQKRATVLWQHGAGADAAPARTALVPRAPAASRRPAPDPRRDNEAGRCAQRLRACARETAPRLSGTTTQKKAPKARPSARSIVQGTAFPWGPGPWSLHDPCPMTPLPWRRPAQRISGRMLRARRAAKSRRSSPRRGCAVRERVGRGAEHDRDRMRTHTNGRGATRSAPRCSPGC